MIETRFQNQCYQIRINRPEARNALNRQMRLDLAQALASAPKGARLVYLYGTSQAFCAGQDLSEFDEQTDVKAIMNEEYRPILTAIETLDVPIIAGVQGACAGAGVSLALACDLVLASEDAFFQIAFGKIGLVPDILVTHILPRLIGQGRALGMALTGEKILAQQALDWGFIWQVFSSESFESDARTFCDQMADGPSLALGLTRNLFRATWGNDCDAQFALEADYQARAARSDDFREGITAFIEKRNPEYRGQ